MGNAPQTDEMYEFLMVLRQACIIIVTYIERRYGLKAKFPTA